MGGSTSKSYPDWPSTGVARPTSMGRVFNRNGMLQKYNDRLPVLAENNVKPDSGWDESDRKSDHSASGAVITLTTRLNSTEIDEKSQFLASRGVLNMFSISTTNWVELSWVGSGEDHAKNCDQLVVTQFLTV